ncbi:MAG: metallophosphoesterase family protein [Patescibacteria group bacterium]
MKYAIFSDSHDHYYNVTKALELVRDQKITRGIHLGDFCAPPVFDILAAEKSIHWTLVWGNVDGARAQTILRFREATNLDFTHDSFRELELENKKKIFLTHFPLLAQNAAKSGDYQAVFFGDNHLKSVETLANGTLLANPGELSGTRTGQPTFGIWDSESNEFEIVPLTDFKVAK